MPSLTNFYKNLPTNRKISVIFLANVLLFFIILSISLAIQYLNISKYQHEVPDRFFASYNRQSLEQLAARAKSYVLSIVDYRMLILTSIYNNIRSEQMAVLPVKHIDSPQIFLPKLPGIISCDLTKPNSTIFSCSMNSYTSLIIQSSWHTYLPNTAKRMTIIYQNKQNLNDIMAKSISTRPDFKISNITKITENINAVRDGYMKLNPFQSDQYGSNSSVEVSAYRVKIQFQRYYVMIQLQVFGTFFRNRRFLYSDDANVVILKKNQYQNGGYQILNSFYPLTLDLNYSKIWTLGYAESILPNGKKIYSYTSSYASQIKMGTASYLEYQKDSSQQFVIIVHSTDVNMDFPAKINDFIENLNHKCLDVLLGVLFVIFFMLILMNSCYEDNKIGKLVINIMEAIRDYAENPKNYFKISGVVASQSFQDYIARPILRNLGSVIKAIESKKKKFAQKSRIREHDKFPLNMLVRTIGGKYISKDFVRFQKLRQQIIMNMPQINN